MRALRFVWLLCAAHALAHEAQAGDAAESWRAPVSAPRIRSPEVDASGRVTLRLWAPDVDAAFVLINGEHFLPVPMHRDAESVWTYTSRPLEPEIYSYNFVVGGASIPDPTNRGEALRPAGPISSQSQVLVPGLPARVWEQSAVPHGVLSHEHYDSSAIGAEEDYFVYTPPGYDPNRAQPYPVLILLHGLGGDAVDWSAAGRADVIADNLLAASSIPPMVMVSVRSYGIADVGSLADDASAQAEHFRRFAIALRDEIEPRIERRYHVSRRFSDRALAGVSMGGAQALIIALSRRNDFAYVGSFSAGLAMLDEEFSKAFPDAAVARRSPKLLWIGCGTDDPLIDATRDLHDWLDAAHVQHQFVTVAGGHEWSVWRRDLAQFLPLLFRRAAD